MNTQALDALAALAAASAVPPAPASAARAAAATNAPSAAEVADAHALLAAHRRAQQQQAQVHAQRQALAREQALAHRRQHAQQEQAHRRAALANLPPDILRAYLAAASSPTSARDALARSGPLPPPTVLAARLGSAPMSEVPYSAAVLDAVPSLDLRAGPFPNAPLRSSQGPLKAAQSLALGPAFGTTKASGGKRPAPKNETAARAVPPKKRLARARAMSEGGGGRARKKAGLHESVMSEWEDKKEAKKRVANRLSAHLSRKRKKLFLEDLKSENQELRRKEQILQSIPDLIVVFDSSGWMPFVSHSVTRFLDYAADELEDSSFWDRLTPGGVRLVKSAFMNALAKKRSEDEDSTPLWDGESRTVRLVDRNGEEEAATAVSLKGVVHFAGESPECVCSIRPLEDRAGAASEDDEAAAAGDAAEGNAADPSFNRISDVDSDEYSKSVPVSRTI